MSFFTKEPLIIGLFCGKSPIKIRHPIGLRNPVGVMCCRVQGLFCAGFRV